MGKAFIICCILILISSCGSETQNKHLSYQNIVILSDLSNRLQKKKPKDIDEIHKIVMFFKNECVKPGEKIGDKSSIIFSTFSQKVTASIELDKIKDLGSKQQFINSTGEFKNSGLDYQIGEFENKVKKVYSTVSNNGLDLISLLIEKIENEPIVKEKIVLTDGVDSTIVDFQNHIYIFTDGYLEYNKKNASSQFYFSTSEISRIRNYCIANKVSVSKALQSKYSLGLPVYKSDKNKSINLHVLETDERDKDEDDQAYKFTKGLRDNDILNAVWKTWAINSGFKSFEWKKY